MNDYTNLKEIINEQILREERNLRVAEKFGSDTVGVGHAIGAIEAYREILVEIEELEK